MLSKLEGGEKMNELRFKCPKCDKELPFVQMDFTNSLWSFCPNCSMVIFTSTTPSKFAWNPLMFSESWIDFIKQEIERLKEGRRESIQYIHRSRTQDY